MVFVNEVFVIFFVVLGFNGKEFKFYFRFIYFIFGEEEEIFGY